MMNSKPKPIKPKNSTKPPPSIKSHMGKDIAFAIWLYENHWGLINVDKRNEQYEFMRQSHIVTLLNKPETQLERKNIDQLYKDFIKQVN